MVEYGRIRMLKCFFPTEGVYRLVKNVMLSMTRFYSRLCEILVQGLLRAAQDSIDDLLRVVEVQGPQGLLGVLLVGS